MKLFRIFFFPCLPVEPLCRVYVSFSHRLISLVAESARQQSSVSAMVAAGCMLPHSPGLRMGRVLAACCVRGFICVCVWEMLLLLENTTECAFIPAVRGIVNLKELGSSSVDVRPHRRAPCG